MGTTKTSIQDGTGSVLAFVLAIEGYTNLITSWESTSAVVTAWAATDYTACISGLQRPSKIEQSIEPFRPRFEAGTTQFTILPDGSDTFGIDVFASQKTGGVMSHLSSSTTPSSNPIALDASDFAASGSAYIGTERFTYSSITGGTEFASTRGKPVPFNRDGGAGFGHVHTVTSVYGGPVGRPAVTDWPKQWVGKWIGCWVHRVVAGVLDTKAQAECIFAGRIADIADTTDGAIVLSCVDARDVVNQVLLSDQWEAIPAEGVYIDFTSSNHPDNDIFQIKTQWTYSDLSAGQTDWVTMEADGTYLSAGRVTAAQYIAAVNDFLNDQTWADTDDWAIIFEQDDRTIKLYARMSKTNAGATTTSGRVMLRMTRNVAGLLGFETSTWLGDPKNKREYEGAFFDDTSDVVIAVMQSPYPTAHSVAPSVPGDALDYDSNTGTWIDQDTWVPYPWQATVTADPGSWGFIEYMSSLYLAKKTTGSLAIYWDRPLSQVARGGWVDGLISRITADEITFARNGEEVPRIKQVILWHEPLFGNWLIKTFASTGTSTYNNATYDSYPAALSVACPWEALGSAFVASALALGDGQPFTVLIEKPTRLADILLPELSLRNAHLLMDSGKLLFVRFALQNAADATHTLTVSDKAAPPAHALADRPDVMRSRETIIPDIKVEYDRDLKGTYHRTVSVSNEQARTDAGGGHAAPLTIRARNSIRLHVAATDEHMRDLITDLAAAVLQYYSHELPVVARSIAAPKWFMTPGASVSLTDNWVRDVGTGTRGISAVPGWVTRVSQDWTTMIGDVDIVLHGDKSGRYAPYSPAAFVDAAQATDGYDHANKRVYLVANTFSLAAEDDDITHFDVGDKVRVIQRSAASPTSWADTIAAKGANYVDLTTGLGGAGALTGSTWYLISDDYATAQSTQQTDCYLADDVDGQIVDSGNHRLWVTQDLEPGTFVAGVTTDRIEIPASDGSWANDGEPVTPIMHRDLVYLANNLTNRKCVPNCPQFLSSTVNTTTTSYVLACFPFQYYLTRGYSSTWRRQLNIGPCVNGAGKVRITSSRIKPKSGTTIGGGIAVTFPGVSVNQEWTNVSGDANITGLQLALESLPGIGWTWITVEIKATSGTFTLYGFHEWWLGAMES